MKFELGQKIKYKRISRKIEIDMQYWEYDDFKEYEEKELIRRELVELKKERVGYVMGRRKIVFRTYFIAEGNNGSIYEPAEEWVEIARQEYGFAYLIAYTMGKTNYILEEDIIPIINSNDDIYKIEGE